MVAGSNFSLPAGVHSQSYNLTNDECQANKKALLA